MYKSIINFIQNLYNTKEYIPLHAPVFIGNEKKYLEECIHSSYVSSVGSFVDTFERMIEDYTGTQKAVVCVNGTNALYLALHICGVKQEHEVLTQAFTFIATCNAIAYTGAQPVFIDIDADTLGMSPTALRKWLETHTHMVKGACVNTSTGKIIKACVPMHTFGHPVKINQIIQICNEFCIDVIEDAAESLGSFYKNKHTGTFGKIGILSFNGNKTITTGGGGMLLCNDADIGVIAKHLSTQAKVPHAWEFTHDAIGFNYRMPNINAALGCAQMENLAMYIANKRETAHAYKTFFETIPDITFFSEPNDCKSNYWLHAILFANATYQKEFLEYSNKNGVMTRPAWTLMNRLPMFAHCQTDGLSVSNDIEKRLVNIPSSVRL